MRMMFALFFLLFTAATAAADTAAVAAALPDEASECRYILRLCEARRPQQERVKALTADTQRQMAIDDQHPPQTTLQRHERMLRNQLTLDAIEEELSVSRIAGKQLFDAMTVVRSKHDQMPQCFEQCQDVIKFEKFK